MARSVNDEPSDYGDNLIPWKADPRQFSYTDGGVLQNQPIGIAKNLVDERDGHEDQDSRFYLFVSPHAKASDANDGFTADNADYLQMVARLLKVVMGQSGFQDWITAQAMNVQISKLDERARELAEAIRKQEIDVGCLRTAADSLLNLLFPNGEHTPPGATERETLPAAQKRIAGQYQEEMTELANAFGEGSAEAEAFRDAVLTFESAAGLGARDTMLIYGITATASELAGASLQAFLGFFDQELRDHDYDVGRTHARQFLMSALPDGAPAEQRPLAAAKELGPIRFYPNLKENEIRPIDTGLNGETLKKLPVADIHQFHAGTKVRLKQMLKELVGGWSVFADLPVDLLVDQVLDRVIARL